MSTRNSWPSTTLKVGLSEGSRSFEAMVSPRKTCATGMKTMILSRYFDENLKKGPNNTDDAFLLLNLFSCLSHASRRWEGGAESRGSLEQY